MKYKKVLFVYPSYASTTFTMPVAPIGIGYLAEFLKQKGIDCQMVDMRLNHNFRDLRKKIYEFNPDLIAISLMTLMYKYHYKLIKLIKNEFPGLSIVAGGPHISTCKNKVLEECPEIDFAVMQDGEIPLFKLCLGEGIEDIPGLIYRRASQIISNPITFESEPELDELPFPKYENFELSKYGFGISIVSSRGCPYRCIYCTAALTRRKFRARSAENVVDEIEYWHKLGFREFDFQEDNPTFEKDRILSFCDELERRNLRDLVIMCGNGVRADKVNKETLKRMREVGFKRLGFGVEAGNNKILKVLKKGETIEVIKKAIQDACDLGFFVSLFFIIGSPSETLEDVQDSIDIALAYPISHVNFFNLIPIPETELFKWVEKNNYFLLKPEVYLNCGSSIQMSCKPVFQTPYFTRKQRVRALKKCKAIERLIKRRTIIKTLDKFYPFNYVFAYCYTLPIVQNGENQLLRFFVYRAMVNKLRDKIRLIFYK